MNVALVSPSPVAPSAPTSTSPVQQWLIVGDEGMSREVFAADDEDAAEAYGEQWLREGDWGNGGCAVEAIVYQVEHIAGCPGQCDHKYIVDGECYQPTNVELLVSVDIPSVEPECRGGAEHRLTDGGDEFGGVRSMGGTRLDETSYCLLCGGTRTEILRGSQRNPGEADMVRWSNTLSKERWLEMRDDAGLPTTIVEIGYTAEDNLSEWFANARHFIEDFPISLQPLIVRGYGEAEVTTADAKSFFAAAAKLEFWDGDGPQFVSRTTIDMPGVRELNGDDD